MQININRIVTKLIGLFFLYFICFGYSISNVQADKKNKLVDFKAFGQWEIWCIDIAQSGSIQCNLNQVLRYKNHPDFRAMIPRFFSNGKTVVRMEIDREWQTGFASAYMQVDDFDTVSLSDCGKPCVLATANLSQIIEQFSNGAKAKIHFHDYLVEEFNVNISLVGFPEEIKTLNLMQLENQDF